MRVKARSRRASSSASVAWVLLVDGVGVDFEDGVGLRLIVGRWCVVRVNRTCWGEVWWCQGLSGGGVCECEGEGEASDLYMPPHRKAGYLIVRLAKAFIDGASGRRVRIVARGAMEAALWLSPPQQQQFLPLSFPLDARN